jgi:hypothetical protein
MRTVSGTSNPKTSSSERTTRVCKLTKALSDELNTEQKDLRQKWTCFYCRKKLRVFVDWDNKGKRLYGALPHVFINLEYRYGVDGVSMSYSTWYAACLDCADKLLPEMAVAHKKFKRNKKGVMIPIKSKKKARR